MKREIVILVTAKDKTEEIWVDGKLKFKHTYNYAEHAIDAGHAYAEQFAHHDPVLRIDMRGDLNHAKTIEGLKDAVSLVVTASVRHVPSVQRQHWRTSPSVFRVLRDHG